jgi:L-alanine-DL-glutamate epimerase-like enolase superfamily enzyme
MMQKSAYDIIQPEVLFSGGITGCRKVAAVAEAFNTRMCVLLVVSASRPNTVAENVVYESYV